MISAFLTVTKGPRDKEKSMNSHNIVYPVLLVGVVVLNFTLTALSASYGPSIPKHTASRLLADKTLAKTRDNTTSALQHHQ